ncbi:DASH complex subunit dad2 [Malassezia caprae]|uniref:DASH complex subunit DAD2 n=1 Tax=Malassezia caprae TaxID=1381934 RepID=A0AAF0E923_9BASI|nr:DASH complex subunit dad2 [Malassezia caprae]
MAPMASQASRTRMSMAPGAGGVSSSVAARISAKQAELQALQHLRTESARLAQELTHLSERVDTLVTGGQTVASVMASWQGVFRAIQLAQAAMSKHDADAAADAAPADQHPTEQVLSLDSRSVPETLVRIPLQASEPSASAP